MLNTEQLTSQLVAYLTPSDDSFPVYPAFFDEETYNPTGTVAVSVTGIQQINPGLNDYQVNIAVQIQSHAQYDDGYQNNAHIFRIILAALKRIPILSEEFPDVVGILPFTTESAYEPESRQITIHLPLILSF